MGLAPVTAWARPYPADNKDGAFVIAVGRSAGLIPGPATAIDFYRFTVTRNGDWEFTPLNGEATKGKLGVDDLHKWVDDLEDGGLYEVESDPELGALDEPFMDITVHAEERDAHVRIRLAEALAQAIEEKIVEVVAPGPADQR